MNKTAWLIFFLIITVADISLLATGNNELRWFTKILIIPFLIGWLITSLSLISSKIYKWVIAALLFSWAGDILLMLESRSSIFFILGLVSFLAAHICYIVFFQVVRKREKIKINWILIFPVLVYYLALIIFLFPHLGSLKIPVIIYGAVISTMLVFALHMQRVLQAAGINMMLGAILFIISDSVLAINKFYHSFAGAGIIIMLTYAFAQLLIVAGVINYSRKTTVN